MYVSYHGNFKKKGLSTKKLLLTFLVLGWLKLFILFFSIIRKIDWLICFFSRRIWRVGCRRLKVLFGRYPDAEVYSVHTCIDISRQCFCSAVWKPILDIPHTKALLQLNVHIILIAFLLLLNIHYFDFVTWSCYLWLFLNAFLWLLSLTEFAFSWVAFPLGGHWRWNCFLVPQTVR